MVARWLAFAASARRRWRRAAKRGQARGKARDACPLRAPTRSPLPPLPGDVPSLPGSFGDLTLPELRPVRRRGGRASPAFERDGGADPYPPPPQPSFGAGAPPAPTDLLDTAACGGGGGAPTPPPPASVRARLAAAAAAAAAARATGAPVPSLAPAGPMVTVPVAPPPPRPPRPPPPRRAAAAPPARRSGGGPGGVTLKSLIDAGLVWPGEDVLSVEYKNVTTLGTLDADGRIICAVDGRRLAFDSPSAFSIFLKRLVNPARKADDGWKTVKFAGRYLEHFKAAFVRGRPAPGGSPAPGSGAKRASRGEARSSGSGDGGGERPRRRARPPRRLASAAPASGGDHDMRPLDEYGPGAPGAPGAAPFRLKVARKAVLAIDLHAHLSTHEVVGLLGGAYDADTRTLTIELALPVLELDGDAGGTTDVEMDAADEWRARKELSDEYGLAAVGWYHSHPTFAPLPSGIDVANQAAQQAAHAREGIDGVEPFVGAIVAPYDARCRRQPTSDVTWFRVDREAGAGGGGTARSAAAAAAAGDAAGAPFRVRDDGEPAPRVGASASLASLLPSDDALRALAERYAARDSRADLLGAWGGPGGGTRLAKLCASLASRLPARASAAAVAALLARVEAALTAAWRGEAVELPPVVAEAEAEAEADPAPKPEPDADMAALEAAFGDSAKAEKEEAQAEPPAA